MKPSATEVTSKLANFDDDNDNGESRSFGVLYIFHSAVFTVQPKMAMTMATTTTTTMTMAMANDKEKEEQ